MSLLAGCMAALGLFIVLIVFLVLILDARQANQRAKRHREILRELQRKETTDAKF